MELKEFKQIVGEALLRNGFLYKKRKYVLENEDLLVFIDFQKSNFSNSCYINYYFIVKELHSKIERLTVAVSDFGSRLGYHNEAGEVASDFDLESISVRQLDHSINEEISNEIMPAFTFGLVKYFELNPNMKLRINVSLQKYLESHK